PAYPVSCSPGKPLLGSAYRGRCKKRKKKHVSPQCIPSISNHPGCRMVSGLTYPVRFRLARGCLSRGSEDVRVLAVLAKEVSLPLLGELEPMERPAESCWEGWWRAGGEAGWSCCCCGSPRGELGEDMARRRGEEGGGGGGRRRRDEAVRQVVMVCDS